MVVVVATSVVLRESLGLKYPGSLCALAQVELPWGLREDLRRWTFFDQA